MKAKWDCFWDRVHVDWHRNNAWPEPFNLVDRAAVKTPIAVMVDRGWQLQNTIPDQLFNAETQELTRRRRTESEMDCDADAHPAPSRVRHAGQHAGNHRNACEIGGEGRDGMSWATCPTLISVTDVIPRDGSASYYERVNTVFRNPRLPPPVLPTMEQAGRQQLSRGADGAQ